VDQALMLRGSRDFLHLSEYRSFLRDLIMKRNESRTKSVKEELMLLNELPENRLQDATVTWVRVGRGSTVRIKEITYSVPSRLIGEEVELRLLGSTLEIWYGGQKVEEIPRLSGANKARIDYRHIIDWLVKKPGAFDNYRYNVQRQ
jgi:hypothetical protein